MIDYIEVSRVDPNCEWLEVVASDRVNRVPTNIHLVINDAKDMVYLFQRRYLAKQPEQFTFSPKIIAGLEEFFQDANHVKIMSQTDHVSDELMRLLQTNRLDFGSPERSSFRKSKPIRVRLFLDLAYDMIDIRDFAQATKWLDWVHLLEPGHELAFELKIVCLRSWKRVSECVEVFKRWISAHPEKPEPRLGLGELWLYLDQNKRAQEVFELLLNLQPNHAMALIGLAQAKARLGEDFVPILMKAAVVEPRYTRSMVEHHFDFRHLHPGDLAPMTLEDVAARYDIPVKRLVDRASAGVLPFHAPSQDGLLRFSKIELDQYYEVLKRLGLEISSENLGKGGAASQHEAAQQLDLFGASESSHED